MRDAGSHRSDGGHPLGHQQARLELFALRHVACDQRDAAGAASGVPDGRRDEREAHRAAVLSHADRLHLLDDLSPAHAREDVGHQRPLLGGEQDFRRLAVDLVERPPEDLARAGVPALQRPVGCETDDRVA